MDKAREALVNDKHQLPSKSHSQVVDSELPQDLDEIDGVLDSSTRGDSETSGLRRRRENFQKKRTFRRIVALVMGLIMVTVLIVVTYVVYR